MLYGTSGYRVGMRGYDVGLNRLSLRNAAEKAAQMRAWTHAQQERAAETNVQNAVDYARTADGWLQTLHSMMGRMGELAVMANDGTKSAWDRKNLQAEFSQMQKAIQSITTGPDAMARFNGIPLFQGNLATSAVFVAPDLSADSRDVIGHDEAGGETTWGQLLSTESIDELSAAEQAATAIPMGLDYVGGLRDQYGVMTEDLAVSGVLLAQG